MISKHSSLVPCMISMASYMSLRSLSLPNLDEGRNRHVLKNIPFQGLCKTSLNTANKLKLILSFQNSLGKTKTIAFYGPKWFCHRSITKCDLIPIPKPLVISYCSCLGRKNALRDEMKEIIWMENRRTFVANSLFHLCQTPFLSCPLSTFSPSFACLRPAFASPSPL